jgi:hypothetical protein
MAMNELNECAFYEVLLQGKRSAETMAQVYAAKYVSENKSEDRAKSVAKLQEAEDYGLLIGQFQQARVNRLART